MDEDKAKMSGGCQGTVRPVRGGGPPGLDDPQSNPDAGGTGSEIASRRRAYRLFLIERLATWPECEELRLHLRKRGWTVLATGGLPFKEPN